MRPCTLLPALALALFAGHASAACTPIRIGFIDQSRPPYYLGNGAETPDPPGANVELFREVAASVGCALVSVRLPTARVRPALEAGLIDFAALDIFGSDAAAVSFPRDKNKQIDLSKSIQLQTIVFMRSDDAPPPGTDPAQYFVGRKLGVLHGAPYAVLFEHAGIHVDDGAVDVPRNLEKLRLHRIDGFALVVAAPADMDAFIASEYGAEFVRLDKPMRTAHAWLAANRDYYARNREQVEAIWNWIGANGSKHLQALLKKYDSNH